MASLYILLNYSAHRFRFSSEFSLRKCKRQRRAKPNAHKERKRQNKIKVSFYGHNSNKNKSCLQKASISLLQRNPPYDFHKEICCVYYKWNCFVHIKKGFSFTFRCDYFLCSFFLLAFSARQNRRDHWYGKIFVFISIDIYVTILFGFLMWIMRFMDETTAHNLFFSMLSTLSISRWCILVESVSYLNGLIWWWHSSAPFALPPFGSFLVHWRNAQPVGIPCNI